MLNKRVIVLIGVSIALLLIVTGCCGQQTPTFDVDFSASPSTFSSAGQVITYTYTVNNPNAISDIKITDSKLGEPCAASMIQPQTAGGPDEKTCTLEYTTTDADVTAGKITNTVTVQASLHYGGGCQTEPTTSSKTASVDVAFVSASQGTPPDTASSGAPVVWSIATAGCNDETTQMEFTVDTGDSSLTSNVQVAYTATDNETNYTCETGNTPGMVNCRGSQSQSPGALTFCLQRSTDPSAVCQTFPDFPSWINGITCQPNWEFSYAACDGPTQVFFVIDTGYAWLDNSGTYGYTATDGKTTYWCDTSQTPGLVNCYGAKAANAGPLEFCLQRVEDTAPLCQTFETFPVRVNMLSCEPTPTVVTFACSNFTTEPTCWEHEDKCHWDSTDHDCRPNP